MQAEAVLTLMLIGLVAGFLANVIAGGRGGIAGNIVVGLLGAVIGNFLANMLDINVYGFIGEVTIATVGAVILLALFGSYNRSRTI